jgi:CheY-like chemotaxis protein
MKTVLVLEDEPTVISFLEGVLTSEGYVVLEATGAEEALQRVEQSEGHVDLLIDDVGLPITSGIRVALRLKESIANLKIILTSGYPLATWRDQDRSDLAELPSSSVVILEKPFAAAALLARVGQLIGPPTEKLPNHSTAAAG